MDKLLQNDLAVKILSLVLAVILWFQVTGETPQTQKPIRGVPVRVRNLPSHLTAAAIEPDTVTVYVRGRSKLLASVTKQDFEAWVDLQGARPGRLSYTVDGVNVPRGITLVDYAPSEVTVEVLPVVEREFAVSAEVQGRPAEGLRAGSPVLSPARVVLRGTERDLQRVAAVTVTLRVDGAAETVEVTRPVRVLDRDGAPVPGVVPVPETVRVTVPVRPETAVRSVPVRPEVAGEPARGYAILQVEAAPASVSLTGPTDAVANLTAVSTEPVSAAGATGDVHGRARLVLPPGVTSTPDAVEVIIRVGGARR